MVATFARERVAFARLEGLFDAAERLLERVLIALDEGVQPTHPLARRVDQLQAIRAVHNMKTALECGFTGAISAGAPTLACR